MAIINDGLLFTWIAWESQLLFIKGHSSMNVYTMPLNFPVDQTDVKTWDVNIEVSHLSFQM